MKNEETFNLLYHKFMEYEQCLNQFVADTSIKDEKIFTEKCDKWTEYNNMFYDEIKEISKNL